MNFTAEQISKILSEDGYTEALRRIQDKIQDQLESANKDGISDIWDAVFTLQYMMDSHNQCVEILKSLNNVKGLKLLKEFYSNVATQEYDDVYDLIKVAQNEVCNEEFRSDLANLLAEYKKEENKRFGGVALIVMATIFLVCIAPSAWMLLVILIAVMAVGYLMTSGLEMRQERENIDSAMNQLSQDKSSTYTPKRSKEYKKADGSILAHTFQPQNISALESSFFKGKPSLKDRVELECNALKLM